MPAHAIIVVLELVGLYTFATSGALMAIHKQFDLVGIVVLAVLTALGGGVLRDLIIGDTPPAAFTNVSYLVIPLVAAGVTFFVHPVVQRLSFTVLVFDAAGLGLFCVTGTLKALDFGLGSLQAVLLGITTAVGGGVLRDITARETPALVKVDTDLYSIPAAAGAIIVTAAYHTSLPMPVVATAAAVLVFAFRLVAMLRHWTAPRPWRARVPNGQLRDEPLDAAADRADRLDVPAGGVVELPAEVALAGEDGGDVAAAHGDEHVG